MAGSNASISANVDRFSRAIANWSATYGITDEHTPTPTAAASNLTSVNAGIAAQTPTGSASTVAVPIASASPSILRRPSVLDTRCPRTTYAANSSAFDAMKTSPIQSPDRRMSVSK